jgi:DNA-binding NtrC family response regulator
LDLLSIPPEMHMAHLVGWRRGAFTSADRDVEGAIARAQGGTLFIDEVDKLSLDTQAGLLRLIEERTWRPLGDSGKLRQAQLRFVVGTNISLLDAVARGAFREDLYYRLHVLPCALPPLAQRADEIEAWANHMLQQRAALDQRRAAPLCAAASALLREQPWPGNLRQLDNVLRRAYVLHDRHGVAQLSADTLRVALAMEQGRTSAAAASEPAAALRTAARALVAAAIQHHRDGHPLDLDGIESMRGLVLEEAHARLGSIKDAFSLFNRQQLVESRNHHKAFKRELERAHAFIESLT